MICVAHHSFYRGQEKISQWIIFSRSWSLFFVRWHLGRSRLWSLLSSSAADKLVTPSNNKKVTLSSYNNWWLSFESFWNGSILPHLGAPSLLVLSSTPRQAKANQPQRSMSSLKRVEPFKKTDRSRWLVLSVERNLTFFLIGKISHKAESKKICCLSSTAAAAAVALPPPAAYHLSRCSCQLAHWDLQRWNSPNSFKNCSKLNRCRIIYSKDPFSEWQNSCLVCLNAMK